MVEFVSNSTLPAKMEDIIFRKGMKKENVRMTRSNMWIGTVDKKRKKMKKRKRRMWEAMMVQGGRIVSEKNGKMGGA